MSTSAGIGRLRRFGHSDALTAVVPGPTPPPAPGTPGAPPPLPPPRVPPAPEPIARYVAMATGERCIRGSIVRVAVPGARRWEVASLTVRAGRYRRTIASPRLAQPIRVRLRARRSRVEVSVRVRDGCTTRGTVTFTRCR